MREDVLRGICADRYDVDKIPAKVDTVVIGSGMSGLTCAAVLSRMGQTVLVLEQHYVAGGGSPPTGGPAHGGSWLPAMLYSRQLLGR
jgi:glycine/D-amino acid oxidase-like deaminating enzyme